MDIESELEAMKEEQKKLRDMLMSNRKAISSCAAVIAEFTLMLMQFQKEENDIH